jgi:hypothetical protein
MAPEKAGPSCEQSANEECTSKQTGAFLLKAEDDFRRYGTRRRC